MVATSPSDVDPTQLSIMQVPALEAAAKQYNLLLYIVHIIILLQWRGGGGGVRGNLTNTAKLYRNT